MGYDNNTFGIYFSERINENGAIEIYQKQHFRILNAKEIFYDILKILDFSKHSSNRL